MENNSVYEFCDWPKILSHNFVITIVCGARGCGKSFGALKVAEQARLRGEGRWVWIRDTRAGLESFAANLDLWLSEYQRLYNLYPHELLQDFWKNTLKKGQSLPERLLPAAKHESGKGRVVINGQLAGFTFLLSTAPQKKGNKFGEIVPASADKRREIEGDVLAEIKQNSIKYVIYDEFIDETIGRNLALKDKPALFESAMESIARKGNTRFLLLANKFNMTSPILRQWQFPPTKPGNIYRCPLKVIGMDGKEVVDKDGKPLTLRDKIGLFDLPNRPPGSAVEENPISQILSTSANGRYILENTPAAAQNLVYKKLPAGLRVLGTLNDDFCAIIYATVDNSHFFLREVKNRENLPQPTPQHFCLNFEYISKKPLTILWNDGYDRIVRDALKCGRVQFNTPALQEWFCACF